MESEEKNAVLTIAGSDSSGGAGIQADIKTFEEFKEKGLSVITAITSQNPEQIISIQEVEIESQLTAVFDYYDIKYVKTGMLYSQENIEIILKFLLKHKFNLIIDPIFQASSGAVLLKEDARDALLNKLMPKAYMITPNIPEAETILPMKIRNLDSQILAARSLLKSGSHSVLLKGGHSIEDPIHDVLVTRDELHKFPKKRVNKSFHGSGCRLSAAIVANLNKGMILVDAVTEAEKYLEKFFII